jgi:hypothetical protein
LPFGESRLGADGKRKSDVGSSYFFSSGRRLWVLTQLSIVLDGRVREPIPIDWKQNVFSISRNTLTRYYGRRFHWLWDEQRGAGVLVGGNGAKVEVRGRGKECAGLEELESENVRLRGRVADDRQVAGVI